MHTKKAVKFFAYPKEFTAFLPGLLFINTMNELYKI